MTRFFLILICFLLSAALFAQSDDKSKQHPQEKKGKLLESLNLDDLSLKVHHPDTPIQEQVKVEAEQYPGLEISLENPVESLAGYKPFTKQELRAYSDLLTDYNLTNYGTTGTARPHKPGKLMEVPVPLDDKD
jgi:hypothetical protein